MMPAMMRTNARMPRTSGSTRRPLTIIQPILRVTAAATRMTLSVTTAIVAVCLRVTPRRYQVLFSENRFRRTDIDGVVRLLCHLGNVVRQLGHFQVPSEAKHLEHLDAHVVEVDLVPGEAVTRRHRVCVMV